MSFFFKKTITFLFVLPLFFVHTTSLFAQSETTPYGACRVSKPMLQVHCRGDGGFLCVDTPEGGVAEKSFILTGRVDQKESALSSFSFRVQHNYTKQTTLLDTRHPQENCGGELTAQSPFCLNADGTFKARIELEEFGPYTIFVSATRISGKPESRTVAMSRVKALSLVSEKIVFDPNILQGKKVDATHVNVTVDLLEPGCAFCDFIGASTGGVTVTVSNQVEEGNNIRQIDCETNVSPESIGRFEIGVPVLAGTNILTMTACNAATKGNCPHLTGITFEGKSEVKPFEILSPSPLPSYPASQYPTIQLSFRLTTDAACVQVTLNRKNVGCLEKNGDARYNVTLQPHVGINVVKIEANEQHSSWIFGWGDMVSPFLHPEKKLHLPSALGVEIPTTTFTNIFLPLLNNFMMADEFQTMLSSLFESMGEKKETSEEGTLPANIVASIPGCDQKALEGFRIALRTQPTISKAKIETLLFANNIINFTINADDLNVGIHLIRDMNHDSIPDHSPLPLKIAFKKALFDIELRVEKDEKGRGRYLVASPFTDCVYKSESACFDRPASLIPQRFVGSAGRLGHFVACDVEAAADDIKDVCKSLNSIDAQTGAVSEKVLDALNSAFYCQGSAYLTHFLRDGIEGQKIANIDLPFSFSFDNGVSVDENHMRLDAAFQVGSEIFYQNIPAPLQLPTVGVIVSPGTKTFSPSNFADRRMMSLELSANTINALLFALSSHLRIDLHEVMLEKFGYSFLEKCDRAEKKDTFCPLRPTVSGLLGTSLVSYGYDVEDANHPLMVRIEPHQALAPRLQILEKDRIELQIGGLRASFFALEVDEDLGRNEFGNWTIKLDDHSNPMIRKISKNARDSQIIMFELTLLLPIQLGALEPLSEDPSQLSLKIIPHGKEATFLLTPLPSTNTTTIPAESLVLQLRQTLQYALALFSGEETGFSVPLPKGIDFSDDQSLFSQLGIQKLEWGNDGLMFSLEVERQRINMAIDAFMLQLLHQKGKLQEYQLP
ncbi:MAG: hypothetical protein A3I05_00880 [Deltaproteobacteria bacterium RIFCSPLOWO2_02_FULL_44_10]|nr:MAG: hypothetical protein A3C46_06555 [Deltaproteobacteria bacterium RIFCSPHIGHO2_02_FULL_44_16]OGQ45310.1 MAG: hypothetical protein A3I05_00880 [Deltaproteobacteria bacterium RIFCSPLOWO2_02_FULL_44_10]